MYNQYDSSTNWKFVKKLGEGGFGDVSLWTNSETLQSVALKRCCVDLDNLGLDERSKLKSRWKQEHCWIRQISIENIVRACPELCPDLVSELNQKLKLPVIVMEYCDGGNLRTKLQQIENVNGFSEHDVRQVLRALANAISVLHERYKITHRDIKPDNIVIKYGEDRQPIYKLTDMGYARLLDGNTIVGSMVGSRNYLAPEIVESAQYKNSVDYWSMGIVAFEIMCGVYPFLQDESLFEILACIKQKPPGCIAITKSNVGQISYHMELFSENRLSNVFRTIIKQWLQSALEFDGRKRGYDAPDEIHKQEPVLTFFTKLDELLNAKIFTVYWLNRSKSFSYYVDHSTTMESLYSSMERDTGVNREHFYFVLPVGHTLDCPTLGMQPIHLYKERFAVEDKPMMYLIDLSTKYICNPSDPFISDALRQFFSSKEQLKPWVLKQCLLSAFYLHHNELRRIQEFVNGVNEYAMSLENEVMAREQLVKGFHEEIVHFNGQATHYEMMVAEGKRLMEEKQISNSESIDAEWEIIAQNQKNLFAEHLNIHRRLKVVLERIRDFMKKSPLVTYLATVSRQVEQFEGIFDEGRDKLRLISTSDIRTHVDSMLKVRMDFYRKAKEWLRKNDPTSPSIDLIIEIHMEFRTILNIVLENQSLLEDSHTRIKEKTREYMKQFSEKFCSQSRVAETAVLENVIERMDDLDISNEEAISLTFETDGNVLDVPTGSIVRDSENMRQAFRSIGYSI